jgi:hypothetical protein
VEIGIRTRYSEIRSLLSNREGLKRNAADGLFTRPSILAKYICRMIKSNSEAIVVIRLILAVMLTISEVADVAHQQFLVSKASSCFYPDQKYFNLFQICSIVFSRMVMEFTK